MILTRIEITNYKQYGGHHTIEIPQAGAIGVIGANGVGKTTLFEAIEWALYSPTSIKSADVKPRVWRGKTEVKVTLDDPVTGVRYLVERELGKGSAKARVYRVDKLGFEEKIVDGASQVTSYVIQHLIGLDHAAFVATFFTRQKELGFFNGSPTARRRDVGKLLGLETIREAQQLIAEDRKRAQADARSYRDQSDAQMRDRDFPAEIAAAEKTIAQAKHALQSASSAVESAKVATTRAESSLAEIEQVREQDAAIGQKLLHRQREHDVAEEQVVSASRELERLEGLAAEREQLQPVAAKREMLEKEERDHSTARQTALRRRELEQLLSMLEKREEDVRSSIRDAVLSAPAPDSNPAWNPGNPDAALEWVASIELAEFENRVSALSTAIDIHQDLETESQRLAAYHKRVEELAQIERSILESGNPTRRITEVQNQLQEINGRIAAASASADRIRAEMQKTQRLLSSLHTHREGEICPTCQRPFTESDTAHAIGVFERELTNYGKQLQEIDAQIGSDKSTISKTQIELQQLNEASKKLTETQASITSGSSYIEEQQTKVDDLTKHMQNALQTLGRSESPSLPEREEARQALDAWRKVVEAAERINRAHHTRTEIATERQSATNELQSLADIVYDEARHREVTEQLQDARQAQSTIERIDADLARREQLAQTKDTAAKIVAEALTDLNTLRKERSALGFDVATHQQAQAKIRSAQEQERIAIEQRHQAEVTVRDAEHRLSNITAEKDRISRLAIEAEARQRDADDLDLMYREFTEFERFAAAWYAPRLSDIASDLVSQVTDGKYDRVEFDNNFSIQVYDGDDEKFPYETFSGGERDAIALCARIALSRVIGGASSTPPGFLVLDEVFGSLDLERRQRLLEMLAAITGANDHFRQVFIISHVDDVRTSPILDDIWRVVETESGTSELHSLGVGVDIGEL